MSVITIKKVDKKVDSFGKKAGMNYFERKKLVKTVHRFGYDTGVNVTSQLIVDGIETTVYHTGKLAISLAKTGGKGIKAGASNVAKIAGETTGKIKTKISKKEEVEEEIPAIVEVDLEDQVESQESSDGSDTSAEKTSNKKTHAELVAALGMSISRMRIMTESFANVVLDMLGIVDEEASKIYHDAMLDELDDTILEVAGVDDFAKIFALTDEKLDEMNEELRSSTDDAIDSMMDLPNTSKRVKNELMMEMADILANHGININDVITKTPETEQTAEQVDEVVEEKTIEEEVGPEQIVCTANSTEELNAKDPILKETMSKPQAEAPKTSNKKAQTSKKK
jgi:galactitol-specific phosphotransferase system IIB component